MSRLLPGVFLVLASLSAFAQQADAPVEKADPIVVFLFLALLIGSGLAYGAYLWWQHRKNPPKEDQ